MTTNSEIIARRRRGILSASEITRRERTKGKPTISGKEQKQEEKRAATHFDSIDGKYVLANVMKSISRRARYITLRWSLGIRLEIENMLVKVAVKCALPVPFTVKPAADSLEIYSCIKFHEVRMNTP